MTEEEKQERNTLSIGELLKIAHKIEKTLSKDHNLSSSEILFIGTMLQASTTTDYMIHNLIKKAHVEVVEMRQGDDEFKIGDN